MLEATYEDISMNGSIRRLIDAISPTSPKMEILQFLERFYILVINSVDVSPLQ